MKRDERKRDDFRGEAWERVLGRLNQARSFTAAELGKKSGLGRDTITLLLKGDTAQPTPETIRRLAKAFNKTPKALNQLVADETDRLYDQYKIHHFGEPHRGVFGSSPWVPAHFVGRTEDEEEICARLRNTHRPQRLALGGFPGVGKTALAARVIQMVQEDFPGGIFWIDAEKPDLRPAWLAIANQWVGIPRDLPSDDQVQALLLQISRNRHRALVVLDNVERSKLDVEPLPQGAHISLLLTARRKIVGFDNIPVGVLKAPADFNLLVSVSERDFSSEEAKALLTYLDGHPLAIELAGVYLYGKALSPDDYLDLLKQDDTIEKASASETTYERTVAQALRTLWESIETPLQEAWSLAAWFEPTAPVSPELSACAGLTDDQRSSLARYHLLSVESAGAWRMHRLISNFGRKAGAPEEQDRVRERLITGCAERSREINGALGFQVYIPDRPHFDAAVSWVCTGNDIDEAGALLLDRIGAAHRSLGEFARARQLQSLSFDAFTQVLGEAHPDTLTARGNLAGTLAALGDLAGAREHQQAVLDARTQLLGEAHPDTLTARGNLALTLHALGDLTDAKRHQESVLRFRTERREETDPDTLVDRGNLALTLHALGDFAGARAHEQIVFDAMTGRLGSTHPHTLTARNNLALTLAALGELPDARDHQDVVLKAREQLLGEVHPDTLTAKGNLARTLTALGDLPAARDYQEAVLEASTQMFGGTHPLTLTTKNSLAETLAALGDLEEAFKHQKAVLGVHQQLWGDSHPLTLYAKNNLALTSAARGDLASARELLETVLDATAQYFTEAHPIRLTARRALAETLVALGDLAGAREHQQAVLDTLTDHYGRKHSDTSLNAWKLIRILADIGDEESVLAVFRSHLAWLVPGSPEGLSADQLTIRGHLARLAAAQ